MGLLGDDEGVLGGPRQEHVLTWTEGGVRAAVLLDDGELLAPVGLHEVLDGGAEEGRERQLPPQHIAAARRRAAGSGQERDLLGADAALAGGAVRLGPRAGDT